LVKDERMVPDMTPTVVVRC